MPFLTIDEKFGARRQSGQQCERHYVIFAADDKTARDYLLATAPATVTVTEPFGTLNMVRVDQECGVEEVTNTIYYGVAVWKPAPDAPRPAGQFQVSFDISG